MREKFIRVYSATLALESWKTLRNLEYISNIFINAVVLGKFCSAEDTSKKKEQN